MNIPFRPLLLGTGFTAVLAALGFLLAYLPIINKTGPLGVAILLAVLYRHFFGYPESIRAGVQFSAKNLLRMAIILFGLRLNMSVILNEGIPLLLRDTFVIFVAICLMMVLARAFHADSSLSILLGIGTGICGASAIAAVSPILQAKEEDTAISAGLISIVGTVFAIGYTFIFPFLPLDGEAYGMWVGMSLHEVAHVALAGAIAGETGLGMALLAKLGRVFLLVPFSLLLLWFMKKRRGKENGGGSLAFPWFLIGFIAMSFIGSYLIDFPEELLKNIAAITSFLLTMAMVGLGLSVNLADLKNKALKPMILLIFTSILLSILTYFFVS